MKRRDATPLPDRAAGSWPPSGTGAPELDYKGLVAGPVMQRGRRVAPTSTDAIQLGTRPASRALGGVLQKWGELVRRADVTVRTSAELEALRGVIKIDGSLRIMDLDVTSLEPLAALRHVSGNLDLMRCRGLTSLQGLERLARTGTLVVERCDKLTSLHGLEALTTTSQLFLRRLTALTDIAALGSLEHAELVSIDKIGSLPDLAPLQKLTRLPIGLRLSGDIRSLKGLENLVEVGELAIRQTPNLTSLQPLDGLRALAGLELKSTGIVALDAFGLIEETGEVAIADNAQLERVGGFAMLRRARGVSITNNPQLLELRAFSKLEEVTGSVEISNSRALTRVDAFPCLKRVGKELEIYMNPKLERIDGFAALENVDELRISYNPELRGIGAFGTLISVGVPISVAHCAQLATSDERRLVEITVRPSDEEGSWFREA